MPGKAPRGATWVTRARPHVDRCATAWLVRRFLDPKARFSFIAPGAALPKGSVGYDMPGAAHGHRGRLCTFEALLRDRGLGRDKALRRVAALVHDVDFHLLREPEGPGLDAVLTGLLLAEEDDAAVLAGAFVVFDALYARERAKGGPRARGP